MIFDIIIKILHIITKNNIRLNHELTLTCACAHTCR
jgi:hypothetical protein